MKVLALDLSTKVGYVVFKSAVDQRPRFGTFKLPKVFDPEDYGTRTWALMEWLEGMIEGHAPDVIAFEGPFLMMGPPKKGAFNSTAQTIRLQIALATVIETVAKKHKIPCYEVASSTAKVMLAGSARLGDEKKLAMVRAAWARGWQVSDDHQADAIAVAMVTYDHLGEEIGGEISPTA